MYPTNNEHKNTLTNCSTVSMLHILLLPNAGAKCIPQNTFFFSYCEFQHKFLKLREMTAGWYI